jgi:hypothetical protein
MMLDRPLYCQEEFPMNAVAILKYGQQTVLHTLQEFPKTAVETPGACGVWSVKDIIAHLASYEQVLVDVLSTFGSLQPANTLLEHVYRAGWPLS